MTIKSLLLSMISMVIIVGGLSAAHSKPTPPLAAFTAYISSEILWCESHCTHADKRGKMILGPYDPTIYPLNELGNLPAGVAQFKRTTFNWMKKLAGRPELKWTEQRDQEWLLSWGIHHGYGKHWGTCYTRAVRKYAKYSLEQEHQRYAEARLQIHWI
jgi:hypothetical protein